MNKLRYFTALILAVMLHLAVAGALIIEFIHYEKVGGKTPNKSPVVIVQASVVDQRQVNAEIETIARKKRQAQAAKQARLQRAKRIAEQRRIAKLKAAKLQAERKALAKKRKLKNQLAEKRRQKKLKLQRQERAQQKLEKQLAEKQIRAQIQKEQQQLASAQLALKQSRQWQREIDRYKSLIMATISQNWAPPTFDKNLTTTLLIRLAPGGRVVSVRIIRGSGNAALDRSAVTAVWKTSPLPVPNNADLFSKFRELNLIMRPATILRTKT